jgi:hypothetical protein
MTWFVPRTVSLPVSAFDVSVGLRLLTDLPAHLRHPVSPSHARAVISNRLARRSEHFLRRVQSMLTPGPKASQVYRQLFDSAGCQYGDVERMVLNDGLESTLRWLLRAGIYLTVEEMKGHRPVIRGNRSLAMSQDSLINPWSKPGVLSQSSGSRGSGSPLIYDLDFARESAMDLCAYLSARGGGPWRRAAWVSPGTSALFSILTMSMSSFEAHRWFSQVHERDPGLPARYRWSSAAIVLASRLVGRPIPNPEHVSMRDPIPIARWLAETRRKGATPFLHCFASAAVAICEAAGAIGADISGSEFLVSGEPFTPMRQQATRSAGVRAFPRYSCTGVGHVAYGCEAGIQPDDVHLLSDLNVVVHPEDSTGPAPLFYTSLSPHAALTLLNVSVGDTAVLSRRSCGCPLESIGWDTHLHTIRSDEKLTAGGSSLLDVDIVRILERDLPSRFGGSALDYQLVDDETADGQPLIRLLVAPNVGNVDESEIERTFRNAIASAGGAEQIMMKIWEAGRTVRVERRAPYMTPGGKMHYVHRPNQPAP